jgi:hypothetical protein
MIERKPPGGTKSASSNVNPLRLSERVTTAESSTCFAKSNRVCIISPVNPFPVVEAYWFEFAPKEVELSARGG